MKISLIVATLGRKKELVDFLWSLVRSTGLDNVDLEIVIVDQNDEDFGLYADLSGFMKYLDVIYLHSKVKGLSYNRNLGLKVASGELVCFPDDDCTYYPDTLNSVVDFSRKNKTVDVILGRIYDRDINTNIIKSWPEKEKNINAYNLYFMSSSITIFARASCSVLFDVNLGAGAKYGSCEDPDYLYRILKSGCHIRYTPSISVWHPFPDMRSISLDKVQAYASGFGFFIRKDISLVKLILLVLLVFKKSIQFVFSRGGFIGGYFKSYFQGLFSGVFLLNETSKYDQK